jgi:tripartite-type tricarboxylate transporter receptor subunit TctC
MAVLKRFALSAALVAGFAASSLSKAAAANDDYPNRMISLICALPPGTGADIIVRYFAEKLGRLVPVTVIVENKAGASGNIAAEYVARSKPDGYTIYLHGANTIAANLNRIKNPQYKAEDLQVVSNVQSQAFMIGVSGDSPIKTLRDLTEAMKKKGDKASYASSNIFGQIVGELYKIKMGLDPTLVQYRTSSQAMNDMNSGAVDYGVWDPIFGMSQAREGRIRLLGISSSERMDIAPDIPTMIEGGVPDMDMRSWFATMVQRTVQPDSQYRGDQEVSGDGRRGSLHRYARRGAGDVPESQCRLQGTGPAGQYFGELIEKNGRTYHDGVEEVRTWNCTCRRIGSVDRVPGGRR